MLFILVSTLRQALITKPGTYQRELVIVTQKPKIISKESTMLCASKLAPWPFLCRDEVLIDSQSRGKRPKSQLLRAKVVCSLNTIDVAFG